MTWRDSMKRELLRGAISRSDGSHFRASTLHGGIVEQSQLINMLVAAAVSFRSLWATVQRWDQKKRVIYDFGWNYLLHVVNTVHMVLIWVARTEKHSFSHTQTNVELCLQNMHTQLFMWRCSCCTCWMQISLQCSILSIMINILTDPLVSWPNYALLLNFTLFLV